MALLNTLANNRLTKSVVGGALNALPGYSTLGANISNPLTNYQGVYHPVPVANVKGYTPTTDQNTGTTDTSQPTSGTYSAGPSAQDAQDAQDKAAALFKIDQGLNNANDGLGRLDNQLNTGLGNIGREYQDAYGRLQGQQQIGERNYNQNRVGQLNEYQANRNNVASGARGWMDAALRTLGAQGAGGGSAARYGVPYQAQQQAAAGNSQAQATNNKNIMALDQGHQDDQAQFSNSYADLGRQRDQGTNDYRSQIENQRAQLLNTIGTLSGQRSIANGGDFRSAQAAAQPYTSRISSILDSIDGLAATPRIAERQVNLSRPDLSQYNWARPEAAPQPQQDQSLSNPLLALFGLQDDQRQQQYA